MEAPHQPPENKRLSNRWGQPRWYQRRGLALNLFLLTLLAVAFWAVLIFLTRA